MNAGGGASVPMSVEGTSSGEAGVAEGGAAVEDSTGADDGAMHED